MAVRDMKDKLETKKKQHVEKIEQRENHKYQLQKQTQSFESSKKTFQSSQSMGAYDLKSVIYPRMMRQVTSLVPELRLN